MRPTKATSNIEAVFAGKTGRGFDEIRILKVRTEERDSSINFVRFAQSECDDVQPVLHKHGKVGAILDVDFQNGGEHIP